MSFDKNLLKITNQPNMDNSKPQQVLANMVVCIPASHAGVFNRKVDFGLFSSVPKPNWYMDSRNDFALIVSVLYLLFKTKISFLVKFDSKV